MLGPILKDKLSKLRTALKSKEGPHRDKQLNKHTLTLKGVIQKQCFTYEAHASGEHEKSHTERTELGIERGPSH